MNASSRVALALLLVAGPGVGLWTPALDAQQRPGLQSLNPDISVIGDFLVDLSPDQPQFTEDGNRFSLREVELGLQSAVDPFFRADVFLALHGGVLEVEEAYLTALSLPWELQARLGRFHLPMGKVNLTHRPELLTVEYPLVVRTYFGPEGFTGTGVGISRIFAPLGFFQEIQLFVLNGIESEGHAHDHGHEHGHDGHDHPEDDHLDGLIVGGPERTGLEQFALLAQLRQFHEFTPATNLELGVSAAVGSVERYRTANAAGPTSDPSAPDVLRAFPTQRLYAAHAVVRWRPPARGLYRSFRWDVEAFGHDGPESRVWGAFSQVQWQGGRRTYLGARMDAVQVPGFQEVVRHGEGEHRHVHLYREEGGGWRYASSGTLTFFPSEFSRFRFAVERTFGEDWKDGGLWRAVFQTTFAIGPHRPHPF